MAPKKTVTSLTLKVKKIHKDARIPVKAHATDAGFDVFALHRTIIPGNGRALLDTGLQFEIPQGYFLKIFDRSGLASKSSVLVGAGVIDADYRGELKILLINYGDFPTTVDPKTAIAQFVILPVPEVEIKEVEDELSTTTRGEKGFGSTDLKSNTQDVQVN